MQLSSLESLLERFGEPDIELEHLRIWIHGRQFPDATDYWDVNWAETTVHCEVPGASVWIGGSILHLSEIRDWAIQCHNSFDAFSPFTGNIKLETMEPNLKIGLQVSQTGRINVEVDLFSDENHNSHHLSFEVDQTYMPKFTAGCENILKKFLCAGSHKNSGVIFFNANWCHTKPSEILASEGFVLREGSVIFPFHMKK